MRGAARRRGRAAVALLALAALLAPWLPRGARTRLALAGQSPAALAHFLADFSNHARLHAHTTGPWQVEEESNNNTCWRYAVAYECGALCVGRATVAACDANARLSHGASDRHRVQFSDRRCWGLPALSWPRLCESLETDSVIGPRAEGGAWLEEQAYVQCSLLATVVGHCDVHAARLLHHRALREALG